MEKQFIKVEKLLIFIRIRTSPIVGQDSIVPPLTWPLSHGHGKAENVNNKAQLWWIKST